MSMKQKIDVFEYSDHICNAMKRGILLTTAYEDEVNTMTIGWGHIGTEWGRTIFVAYVRESRYTRTLLDKGGEFTVNIPFKSCDDSVLHYCGTKSGRNCNKILDLNLTPERSNCINVPGIKEFPLTLECKIIYRQPQDLTQIPADILERFYQEDDAGFQDYHIMYYGEVLDAYLITE